MARDGIRETGSSSAEGCRRREEILIAATALFAEHGYSDAITQLLAERLAIGKGTIYRHFPSKQALFFAAADRAMIQLHAWIQARVSEVTDPIEQIAVGVRAYLDFFDQHPEFVELLIQERAAFKDRARPTYFEHREVSVERWRERYRTLIAEGKLREMPVERISDVFTAVLYGSMFLNHLGRATSSFRNGAEDILDVIFHGILSDRERAKPCGSHSSAAPVDSEAVQTHTRNAEKPANAPMQGDPYSDEPVQAPKRR